MWGLKDWIFRSLFMGTRFKQFILILYNGKLNFQYKIPFNHTDNDRVRKKDNEEGGSMKENFIDSQGSFDI